LDANLRIAPLSGKIVLPWWNPQIPFRLADEAFSGRVADLALCNSIDPLVGVACPHVARWIHPFLTSIPSFRAYLSAFVTPFFPLFATRSSEYLRESGGQAPMRMSRRSPDFYPFLREMVRSSLAQTALADYHFVLQRHFEIYSPTPDRDQFIAQRGPWFGLGYRIAGSDTPLDSSDFLISYRSPATTRFDVGNLPAYRRRIAALESSPHTLFYEVDANVVSIARALSAAQFRKNALARLRDPQSWRRLLSRIRVSNTAQRASRDQGSDKAHEIG